MFAIGTMSRIIPERTADVTDFAAVRAAIRAVKPRLVLNAAAYTAVDRAETKPEAAYAAYAAGAKTVARAAALQQVPLIRPEHKGHLLPPAREGPDHA